MWEEARERIKVENLGIEIWIRIEKMKVKEFDNYVEACTFRDKVNGQTQWSSYHGKPIWYVWY